MRRHATLATVSRSPGHSLTASDGVHKIVEEAEKYLVRAQRQGADLVAFTEVYPQLATPNLFHHPEPADDGTLPRLQEIAKKLQLYIVWPRLEVFSHEKGLRNSSILIGRDGKIVGRYFKVFPTISEIEGGVIPGTEVPVFETDFGKVAMLICFDLNFLELREALRPQKPDLLVFSSMYRGGLQLREWAMHLGCHVLSSIKTELGMIVDPGGRVLEEVTYEALVTHRCNLNKRRLHMDYNWDKMDAMLAKYGKSLTFEYYTREAHYVIGYEKDDKDVDEIIAEFGLEHAGDYLARARRVRKDKLRALGAVDKLASRAGR
jgi:predicted amidohydrolase